MDKIILVDKIPFSEKIHRWYSKENVHLFDIDFNWDDRLYAFYHMMPEESNGRLTRLTCDQFFTLLNDIMDVSDGVAKQNKIPFKFTLQDIEQDIEKLKKCLIFWCLVEDVELEKFGTIDDWLFEKDKLRVNKKFHFICYYIFKNIEKNFEKLKKLFRDININNISDLQIITTDNNEVKAQLLERIREAYKGDLEDFVLSAINKIQFDVINENHEKIAQMIRFQFMDIPNFEENLPAFESWRFTKPNYFDQYEDVFDDFFKQFPFESIDYFINDFLSYDFGITNIPFYYCFYNKNTEKIYTSIISCINIKEFDRRKREIYADYMNEFQ